jgi:hypothetical protein
VTKFDPPPPWKRRNEIKKSSSFIKDMNKIKQL